MAKIIGLETNFCSLRLIIYFILRKFVNVETSSSISPFHVRQTNAGNRQQFVECIFYLQSV